MAKQKQQYKSVREQVEQGKDLLIDPLDYRIMELLPDQGTLMGGLVPIGETVRQICKTFNNVLDSNAVGGRLSAMHFMGYVVPVQTGGRASKTGRGWQITKQGKAKLAEWKLRQPGETDATEEVG